MTVSDRFLQQLVEHYLPSKGVRVAYSEAINGLDGEADLKQRTIRIHPYQSQSLSCNVGGAATYNPLSSTLPPEGVAWTEEVARDEERKVKARSMAVFG